MKFLPSKKAVSPIIAVLLLIAIAVAAAVITYIWVMGFIGMATTARVTAQGQIQIEEASFSDASHATLYVRNVGSTTVTLDAVYVIDNSAGTTAVGKWTASSTTLSAGESLTGGLCITDINPTFKRGHSYTFKVVCADGTTAVYTSRW
ncbi:type IV pilin [Candidatus Bathyarchaeota archaeon]|nr:type IV pilin [Candidatus Bathyarchaeota archaeon]